MELCKQYPYTALVQLRGPGTVTAFTLSILCQYGGAWYLTLDPTSKPHGKFVLVLDHPAVFSRMWERRAKLISELKASGFELLELREIRNEADFYGEFPDELTKWRQAYIQRWLQLCCTVLSTCLLTGCFVWFLWQEWTVQPLVLVALGVQILIDQSVYLTERVCFWRQKFIQGDHRLVS